MRVLIVGPGSMGSLFAALLTEAGQDVWLLCRRHEVVEAIKRDGITVLRDSLSNQVPVRATLKASDAVPADLVLLSVKAYSTLQAAQDALPAIGTHSLVLTLQNGLNNVEAIASVVGRGRVIAGVTAQGANLARVGVVRHAGEGETAIGELDGGQTGRLRRIVEVFQRAGIPVEISRSVTSLLWGKLVVNAAINPITALLRVPNGELTAREDARALMAAVVREAVSVAAAKGVELPYPDPIERVETVCRLTATNRSSMLQDVERGTQTEIDYINGALVREGEVLGVSTPINWTLTRLVMSLS